MDFYVFFDGVYLLMLNKLFKTQWIIEKYTITLYNVEERC